MRSAVIGGGVSGLAAAHALTEAGVEVVVYEKEDNIGGCHAKTVAIEGVDIDLGFMPFNRVTDPNMMGFFESLGIEKEYSDMSFSVSLDGDRGCEWSSNGLFAQKKNLLNPYFWQMVRKIVEFKEDVMRYLELLKNNPDIDRNETLGQFVKSQGYSELFQKAYLIPVCSSILSCSSKEVMNSSAFSVLSICYNHHVLQMFDHPQWLRLTNGSKTYVRKVREVLENRGCQIRTGCKVQSVLQTDRGCTILCSNNSEETYDGCIVAVHAPEALRLLGKQATFEEKRLLGAFLYKQKYIHSTLNKDISFMPKNPAAWSARNFQMGTGTESRGFLTYWLNVMQNLGETNMPFLETVNPSSTPNSTLMKWSTSYPVPSVAASRASLELHHIQGKRGVWFCGAYQGVGFHEDGFKAGMAAAHGMIGKQCALLDNPRQMAPSLLERGARYFVSGFLEKYISDGTLILKEEGGSSFAFEGSHKKCPLKVTLKIHNLQFYWKIMTQADLGLAEAYINGDISFVDKDEGLLNLIQIFIANSKSSVSRSSSKRGWCRLLLCTAGLASIKYLFNHALRKNTLGQAQRNISRHYDLSNDFFKLFLDETMTYSCAIFKTADEELTVAQERKMRVLIDKARLQKHHHVLEIGCGWGSLAIEAVKQTGCKYTGITLSQEQLKYAETKVKEVGLQDHIKFLLCDYRQLPDMHKFDRVISCEMIEHVGHQYMEDFFRVCESVLIDGGLLVLQFSKIADQLYDEFRHSPGFIKEYIFPGVCLPSLNRITSAMTTASNLCVEHLEDIGIHYYPTLRCWRKNFLERRSEVLDLGFDEKFIRMWEYYLDYCAAGFMAGVIGNYQIVFSRTGNVTAFSNPYESSPGA